MPPQQNVVGIRFVFFIISEFDLRGTETRTRTGLTALPYHLFQTKVLLLDDGDFGAVTLNFFNHLVDGRVAGLLHDVVHAGRLEDDGNVCAVDAGIGLDLNLDGLATLEHGDAEGELLGDVGLDGLTEGVVAVSVLLIVANDVLVDSGAERFEGANDSHVLFLGNKERTVHFEELTELFRLPLLTGVDTELGNDVRDGNLTTDGAVFVRVIFVDNEADAHTVAVNEYMGLVLVDVADTLLQPTGRGFDGAVNADFDGSLCVQLLGVRAVEDLNLALTFGEVHGNGFFVVIFHSYENLMLLISR